MAADPAPRLAAATLRSAPMTRRRPPKPTPAELRILQALWRIGQGTVRDVLEETGDDVGYTTVLKLLQIMLEKNLVRRDESRRPHVWAPAIAAEQTRSQIVRGVIDGAFAGSAADLVLHALQQHRIGRDELERIRALLREKEGT